MSDIFIFLRISLMRTDHRAVPRGSCLSFVAVADCLGSLFETQITSNCASLLFQSQLRIEVISITITYELVHTLLLHHGPPSSLITVPKGFSFVVNLRGIRNLLYLGFCIGFSSSSHRLLIIVDCYHSQ